MASFEILKWVTAVASVAGVILNVKRLRACFYVWACTNLIWTVVDIVHGIWAQACLQAIYFCLAIWGIVAWKERR